MFYGAVTTQAVSLSILLVLLIPTGLHCSKVEYYVKATNGTFCPENVPCESLSYYVNTSDLPETYSASNAVFYFLPGTHTLNGTWKFENFPNWSITLQGAVMQPSPIVSCKGSEGSMEFVNGGSVYVNEITIQSCGKPIETEPEYGQYPVLTSLLIKNVLSTVSLDVLSVEEGTGFGLIVDNCPNVSITNSNFTENGYKEDVGYTYSGGNVQIAYNSNFSIQQTIARLHISTSSFIKGYDPGSVDDIGSGLSIVYKASNTQSLFVTLLQLHMLHNFGVDGANLAVFLLIPPKKFSLIATNLVSKSGSPTGDMTLNSYSTSVYIAGEFANDTFIQIQDSIFQGCGSYCQTSGIYLGLIATNSYSSSGKVIFDSCTISNFYSIGLFLDNSFPVPPASVIIRNTSFKGTHADAYQGCIVINFYYNVLFDDVAITDNEVSGILCQDTTITFKGNITIRNNSMYKGGGIALLGNSFLILHPSAQVSFICNTAFYTGGAIYVENVYINEHSYGHNIPLVNDLCFYQLTNSSNLSLYTPITFTENKATITGSVLYGGYVRYCNSTFSYLFKYNTSDPYAISSDPLQICLCDSGEPVCDSTPYRVPRILYAGETFNVSIAAIGQLSGFSSGYFFPSYPSPSTVYLNPADSNSNLEAKCTNTTFLVFAETDGPYDSLIFSCLLPDYTGYYNVPYSCTESNAQIIFNVADCPLGFALNSSSLACQCNQALLLAAVQSQTLITCDINTQQLFVTEEFWTGYNDTIDCFFAFTKCPFDYCSNLSSGFMLSQPSSLCNENRTGVLCGQCIQNYSLLLGSNRCGECKNISLTLILAFAFAGICLLAMIIALNLTVSMGAINGLIFYANIVKLYGFRLFSKCPVPFLSQFIAWLNFDLGIETCFYDGMRSCDKTWLQFAFPGYIWFLILLIILLSRRSIRLQKLVGSHAVSVLATLFLLSYQKIIENVILALYSVKIDCYTSNGSSLNSSNSSVRWLVDADITFLTGCHLSLFIFALAVMVLLIIPYTCLLLLFPLIEGPLRTKSRILQSFAFKMKPFFDAYGGPYKDKFRFWTGFLISVRIFLALLVSLNADETLSLNILTSILFILVFLHVLAGSIYRHKYLSVLEAAFLLDLAFLMFLSAAKSDQASTDLCLSDGKEQYTIGGVIMLSIAFVLFIGIVAFHFHARFEGKFPTLCRRENVSLSQGSSARDDNLLERMLPTAPTTTVTLTGMASPQSPSDLLRESLLFDPDDN